jgi:hypothetical protein
MGCIIEDNCLRLRLFAAVEKSSKDASAGGALEPKEAQAQRVEQVFGGGPCCEPTRGSQTAEARRVNWYVAEVPYSESGQQLHQTPAWHCTSRWRRVLHRLRTLVPTVSSPCVCHPNPPSAARPCQEASGCAALPGRSPLGCSRQ